ncbi:MAG TPA: TonB family protein, partial [Thermomonas sp.]|nr:TonB family protein [Thermomonas sp.]
MPEPSPTRPPLLPPRLVIPLAIAFGIGLLLFLLLWLDQRNDSDFFKAGGPATGEPGSTEALPAPVPADIASEDGNASGLRMPSQQTRPATAAADQPRIIEPPAPPVAPPADSRSPAMTDSDAVPVSRPAPRYPPEALRRNIGGSVRVQATVAPDGSVERLELAQGSGNRDLDRAALEAVRRW